MKWEGSYDLKIVDKYENELDFHPEKVTSQPDATLLAWKIGYSPLAVSVEGWTIQVRVMDGIPKAIPSGMVESLLRG